MTKHPRKLTKPDFSDPGYGEIGCFFMAIGIVAGFVIAFVIAVTGLVPDPNPSATYNFPVWLAEVTLGVSTIGILATIALMWAIERLRWLWGVGERLVLGAWVVIPAIAVLLLTLTSVGAALVVPLSVGTILVYAVMVVLMIAETALPTGTKTGPALLPQRAVRQAIGRLQSMRLTRGSLAGAAIIIWLGAGLLFILLPDSDAGKVGVAVSGVGLVILFGWLGIFSLISNSQFHVVQRVGVAVLSFVMVGLGLAVTLLAAGYDDATISERVGPLMLGGMGVALALLGAYAVFWSHESLWLRASGLITVVAGAWMVWSLISSPGQSLF